MLIGICGSKFITFPSPKVLQHVLTDHTGICAGKNTIAQYLVDHHGFKRLLLESEASSPTAPVKLDAKLLNGTSDSKRLSTRSSPSPSPTASAQTFSTPDTLLDFVTQRWRERWVTTAISQESTLEAYHTRPFFLLISVDAPLSVRYHRYLQRSLLTTNNANTNTSNNTTTLESFVTLSDTQIYAPSRGLAPLLSAATVRLLNTSSSLAHLYATLGKVDLLNEDRLRPSWDLYFMSLASLAAQRSNCMKRRVGCVLIRSKRVISTGYNGTPRGIRNCGEGGCPRCNTGGSGSGGGLATCLCIHAEENALLEAGRERIRDEGAILYCNTCPCLTCSIKIVQVGISEVVYAQGYSMDGETAAVFREAGVRLRKLQYPPANGLIHLEKMEV